MKTLNELIKEGEHVRQDFKFSVDDLSKIAQTLCAFANTEGGRLLIGIKDNRKVVGCHPEEELHNIRTAAASYCQPEVEFTSKIWKEDFRLVVEIDVLKSKDKLVKARDDFRHWRSYIRIGDHTTAINKILERVWFEKQKPKPKPDFFTEEENILLKIIDEAQPVSLSMLYRKSKLPLKDVDKYLVQFIVWDLLNTVFMKDGIYYEIRKDKNQSLIQ